jgi:hypothetical protein
MPAPDRLLKWLAWIPALYAAHIMLWYEQFKLTGAEGSVMLFNTLADWLWISGYEQPFRLSVAVAELIACVLLINTGSRMYSASCPAPSSSMSQAHSASIPTTTAASSSWKPAGPGSPPP